MDIASILLLCREYSRAGAESRTLEADSNTWVQWGRYSRHLIVAVIWGLRMREARPKTGNEEDGTKTDKSYLARHIIFPYPVAS